ncbi:MAG: cation:proton antiporter [Cyanobacteriota bacterium]|nr:cation:proton antiporter [Cyanobacteriota bacterium]
MIGYLNLILRLIIWFLLTSDLSVPNIIIGVTVALILPHKHKVRGALKDWLRAFWEIVVAIPIAYIEAFEMIFRPHDEEDVVMERVPPRRSQGLIFLDIFLITFTPKTIVLKYRDRTQYELELGSKTPENIVLTQRELGWYEVHRVRRGGKR